MPPALLGIKSSVTSFLHWLAKRELWLLGLSIPTLMFPGRWTVMGLFLVALGWIARRISKGHFSARTPLDLPILLLLAMAVVGLAVSSMPAVSATKFWGIFLGTALFYGLVNNVLDDHMEQAVAYSLAGAGLVLAVLALVGTDWRSAPVGAFPWLDPLYERFPTLIRGLPGSGIPRPSDLFHPREVGGTLALLTPLSLGLFYGATSLRLRLYLGTCTAGMAVVMFLTQTMSGIVGVLVALGLMVIVGSQKRRRRWLLGGLTFVGALGLALWAMGAYSRYYFTGGLSQNTDAAPRLVFGLISRLELWPRALQMIHDTPYTGIGLNTFPFVMERFYPTFSLGPEPHSHNLLLQTAVDLGLPGLVALVWLLTAFFFAMGWSYGNAFTPQQKATLLGLGGGIVSYLVYSSVDAVVLGAKPGAALWVMMGLGLAIYGRTVSSQEQPFQYWKGRRPALGGWERRLTISGILLLVAAALVPLWWAGPQSNWGRVLSYRALLSPSQAEISDGKGLAEAARLVEAATQSQPSNSNWHLLASLYSRTGEQERALAALQEGVEQDRHNPLTKYAPFQILFGPKKEPDTEWRDLLMVYEQWTVRYPQRAEWWVASAIAYCQGLGDGNRAQEKLDAGDNAGAQPKELIDAYRQRLKALPKEGRCPP